MKINVVTAFKPGGLAIVVLLDGEDRDEHALFVELGLLDEIGNEKAPLTCLPILDPKEEPIVVTIGIQIILDQ